MMYGFEKYAEAKDWFFHDCPYCHDNCEVQVESGIEERDGEEYEVFMVVCNACDYTTEAYGDESEAVDAWNSGEYFRDWSELPDAQECSPHMDAEYVFEAEQRREGKDEIPQPWNWEREIRKASWMSMVKGNPIDNIGYTLND